mgnify:CR=1 FL=1
MDITLFRDIPEPKRRSAGMGLNVLPSGKITFNKKFMEQLESIGHCVRIQMLADGSKLLVSGSKDGYKIPTRGILMNIEFTRYLVSVGISLPVHYDVLYDEKLSGWLCSVDKMTNIDNYVNRATKKKGRRTAATAPGAVL